MSWTISSAFRLTCPGLSGAALGRPRRERRGRASATVATVFELVGVVLGILNNGHLGLKPITHTKRAFPDEIHTVYHDIS